MGRVYTFICPRCEYRAHVSGGREEGFHCVTQTVRCRDCRALHDVVVRVRLTEAEAEAYLAAKLATPRPRPAAGFTAWLPPMLLFGSPPRTHWVEVSPACPVSSHHQVEAWSASGNCPRCGSPVERELMPYRIWD